MHTIRDWGPEFYIKFKLMIISYDNGIYWGSILRFTVTDTNKGKELLTQFYKSLSGGLADMLFVHFDL